MWSHHDGQVSVCGVKLPATPVQSGVCMMTYSQADKRRVNICLRILMSVSDCVSYGVPSTQKHLAASLADAHLPICWT